MDRDHSAALNFKIRSICIIFNTSIATLLLSKLNKKKLEKHKYAS